MKTKPSKLPVVVYPMKQLEELKEEISKIKKNLSDSTQPVFDSTEELFKQLDVGHHDILK